MIAYFLLAVIVAQQALHYYERRDLYNRIMSRNIYEYKAAAESSDKDESKRFTGNPIKKVLDNQYNAANRKRW